jgi:hypothetical protein
MPVLVLVVPILMFVVVLPEANTGHADEDNGDGQQPLDWQGCSLSHLSLRFVRASCPTFATR